MIPKRTLLAAFIIAAAATGCLHAEAARSLQKTEVYTPASDTTMIEVYKRTDAHVRLWPNPTYNGTVVVRSETDTPVHFYVFDAEGTLLYQALIKQQEKKTITELKKGEYLYDVFKNDESVERGKIIVK